MQPLYTHLAKYASSVQVIEKEWKRLEKAAQRKYMYTSVAVQTVKDGKMDKESLAKLNQVIIDGLLV